MAENAVTLPVPAFFKMAQDLSRAMVPPAVNEDDSYSAEVFAEVMDRTARATLARATAGISPAALGLAYFDWMTHLAGSPGKQMKLGEKALRKWMRLGRYLCTCAQAPNSGHRCIEPLAQDSRFDHEGWDRFPFNVISQSFLLQQQWWHNATTGVRGVSPHHERVVEFATRQILDVFSPANFPWTNPEVIEKAQQTGGNNFLQGTYNLLEDLERLIGQKPPAGAENYPVGERLAVTPGKVVYRNHLIELIQYEPATDEVRPEPVLIVPAWIMKYYILDLSPDNSLVRYLTGQGYTVFMVSWRNPGKEDRDLGMTDYLQLGVSAALEASLAITGASRIHMTGYCLGGTLLAIFAAALAHTDGEQLASLSLFAAQVDFTEAGELTLFIDKSEVTFLEDMMWEQGFLDTRQMAGAFQLLRSNDLIWSKVVRDYLLGERTPMFDLMAWNADQTRMPYRMHSEYLNQLFLQNDFAEGRYRVGGVPVVAEDIDVPIFAVGTEHDHVAPWRSVYKINYLADSEVTFILTAGGHNAGIVSEPGHKGRHYRIATRDRHDGYLDPDSFLAHAKEREGSWWPAWVAWLDARSGAPVAPPSVGAPEKGFPVLQDAPGSYVLMK
ncbi:alpha/beta fold hydrolase [Stappia sp. F7233]|uniref:Alpha/beta fold hydrolase n=1 Tax=Stappia albiluteola TaxID=2758565 RepID=A0A839AIX7_9HYPH|nr:alpha/beta fold hydrolase [Stappia albiluteola]MBA5778717.1 alpha/beta fold hydrolase [Stappia albiluteola]